MLFTNFLKIYKPLEHFPVLLKVDAAKTNLKQG